MLGQLGRGPDILAPYIITLYDLRETLSAMQHPRCDFGANVVNYYHYCLENDLFLTHALGDPQVDRGQQPQNEQRATREDELVLHVVEETSAGIIVRGPSSWQPQRPSATRLMSPAATFVRRGILPVSWLSPSPNTPGLKILCREPVSQWVGSYGHPLGMLYDEQDAMLFFDNVLVPWERVFTLYDASPILLRYQSGVNFIGWANLCRIHARMRLMTAVATMIAEAIGVIEYREVAAKLGEMITYVEMWRHAMDGVEHNAFQTKGGLMSLGSMSGMNIFFAQTSARMVQLRGKSPVPA